MNLKIISAGAGSGKTYRLTSEMVALLASGKVRASGIIATTFTKKAAAELQERVRVRLLEEGLSKEANDLANALIGTVHGLGVKMLKRFAFEAGVSPETDIISDDDQQAMFNRSLAMVLSNQRVAEMEELAARLGFSKSEWNRTDWRRWLKEVTEVVRANDLSAEVLDKSKQLSWQSFQVFLDEKIEREPEEWAHLLTEHLEGTITALENNGDTTKVTANGTASLREILEELKLRGELFWHQWVKISKTKVGAKSREHLVPLVEFVNTHLGHPAFHEDVKSFIFNVFDIANEAIEEFDRFKKSRGLIDYTDMEVLVNNLLDDPMVQEVLAEELDLLMVDEFQDTSPIQLEIFLKLSKFAKHSIWVGDPKQSIYGFRGAEPALMNAIIDSQGGLKKENILEYIWRSREDVVNATNAIFTEAFSEMPEEQVALVPKRCKVAHAGSSNAEDEPTEIGAALNHWHFRYDGEGRKPGRAWLNQCVASEVAKLLERGWNILPKGGKGPRPARPGDVAVLCRSNKDCQAMAEALHRAGIRAAISRAGLMGTAEARLILACLKFVLNRYDSLSTAEILLLAARLDIEEIIEDRLEFLDKKNREKKQLSDTESPSSDLPPRPNLRWAENNDIIQRLNRMRMEVVELSSAEILTLLLEELDLRRTIVSWGNVEQRLANVDEIIRLSLKYEEACNRLHTAASLGGFLLWLSDLENEGTDTQGSGDNPLAVNVLTYHRSKGLEYPIVICHSLEGVLRDEVWGIELLSERPEVDLDDLLGGRWVRLWVNPYADQFRGTLLAERIADSEARSVKRQQALKEEARLLYVGITRARDYLIFPTYHKPPTWLNRVCGNGDQDRPALDADSDLTPWEWKGQPLEIRTESIPYPADLGHAEPKTEEVWALPSANGQEFFTPYFFDFSNGNGSLQVVEEFNYSSPLQLPEVTERQLVGKAVRSFFISDGLSIPSPDRHLTANQLLYRLRVESLAEPEKLVEGSEAFQTWLASEFPEGKKSILYPVRVHFGEQLFETTLDLVVQGNSGTALLVHSPFVGNTKSRKKRLRDMSGYLTACRQAMQAVLGVSSVGVYVNFVLEGQVVRLA